MERYTRNRIYISDEEQAKVKATKIFLGGAGIGSIIAECALRMGFEKIEDVIAQVKAENGAMPPPNCRHNYLSAVGRRHRLPQK